MSFKLVDVWVAVDVEADRGALLCSSVSIFVLTASKFEAAGATE